MGRGRKGGNPEIIQKPIYNEAMAEIPLAVRVDKATAEYVRSQPNRTEWLRQAIAAQVERDKAAIDVTKPCDVA